MNYQWNSEHLHLRAWQRAVETVRAWWRIGLLGAITGVLLLNPSSYTRLGRGLLLRQMYVDTIPNLFGFTVLIALLCMVITRIVVVTATSYGLSQYALEMVIRVLVLELIPLTAALFVATRCTIPNGTSISFIRMQGQWESEANAGHDPLRIFVLPRVVSGVYACITLVALSCVVATMTAYVAVYGLNTSGTPVFTRLFGQVFSVPVAVIFVLKTLFFSLSVALIPMATAVYEPLPSNGYISRNELKGLSRMLVMLLLVEVLSLLGNYY